MKYSTKLLNRTLNRTFLLAAVVFTAAVNVVIGCSSKPIKPAAENVKISREDASSDCRDLGGVEGRNPSVKGTFEQALEDLKLDASRKGANFVRIEQTSGTGTAVRGTAYLCP